MATAADRQARDLQAHHPEIDIRTIVDVGANVGHTVEAFHEAHPNAAIWAFEPVGASFDKLRQVAARLSRVEVFRLALAESDRQGLVSADGTSNQNALVGSDSSEPRSASRSSPATRSAHSTA